MASPHKPAYATPIHIKEVLDISTSTLRRWALAGKIRYITVPTTGRRLYHEEDVRRQIGVPDNDQKEAAVVEKPRKVTILYSRVSDDSQLEDLQRQKDELAAAYPEGEHTADVASGLDWNRHGFEGVLGKVCRGEVESVVVSHKDRLARYGVELVEWVLRQNFTKLVVLHKTNDSPNPTELQNDLLRITTFFAGNNGSCSVKPNSRARRGGQTPSNPYHKDQVVPNQPSEKSPDKVVRRRKENV